MSHHELGGARGFSLLETLIAASLVAVAVVAIAHLVAIGAEQTSAGRRAMTATVAAQSKLEQLRSLTWSYAADGAPLSDLSTDTAADPPSPAGGTGLSLSPPRTLVEDIAGYVDYLDDLGGLAPDVDAGDRPQLVRRWAISLLDASDPHTLILQVCVYRWRAAGRTDTQPEACLWTVRTRER